MADQLLEELLKVPVRVWRETLTGVLECDDLADLPRIRAPALMLWGDADGLVGHGMQRALLDLLPNATLLTYAGVGHTPRWEQPERFAADLTTFVDQVG
jgi:pimeloyl-ACP methyl ester carboxylesterase